ncbi:MAG: spore coat U domain-containing protein [Myxococcota bacterium]
MSPSLSRAVALAALLAVALAARRAEATTSCAILSVDDVELGEYDPLFGVEVDSTGGITFECEDVGPGDSVVIAIDRGSGASGFSPRQLLSGAHRLAYNLYMDAARMLVWGDGSAGTNAYGPVTPPSGQPLQVPIYGRIAGGQNVPVGSYRDTLTVTLVY